MKQPKIKLKYVKNNLNRDSKLLYIIKIFIYVKID